MIFDNSVVVIVVIYVVFEFGECDFVEMLC